MNEKRTQAQGKNRRVTPSGRHRITVLVAMIAAGALFAASEESSSADACVNEAVRSQQEATHLPQCRAYEMVTPPAKGSGEPAVPAFEAVVTSPVDGGRTSLDGERVAWVSQPVPGAVAPGASWLATRGGAGWSSESLIPPMSLSNDLGCPLEMGVSGWADDLKRSLLDLPAGPPAANAVDPEGMQDERECGHDEPRLVPGEPEHFRNLFVHDRDTDSYQLVNVTPPDVVWPEPEELNQDYWPASFLAGSNDLTHVVFEEELSLTPDAPIGYRGGDELYEWVGGQVRLVTILPGGTPVHGTLAGATKNYAAPLRANVAQFRHAVSGDGSRIFFNAEGGLFLRENGTLTRQVDESHGPDPSGGGDFMVASSDGARVFFTADRRLTPDSTASTGEPDLYEYRLQPDGSSTLKDLTVSSGPAAHVLGVSGASEDGEYVYFVAYGVLSSAPNSENDLPVAGEANLYLFHGGKTTFVATLDSVMDSCDWTMVTTCGGPEAPNGSSLTARVSRGGEFIGFNSVRSLTGYDNSDPVTGDPLIEIFLFDAGANQLSCVSCPSSGAPPTGGAAIHWPAQNGSNGRLANAYPQRHVSDIGQVFFETVDSLSPEDTNGVSDVYEFFDGSIHLLSTGGGESGSMFVDATPDGSDVFFATAQSLVSRDVDSIDDYYDARIEGGFLEPPPAAPGCEGASCRILGSASLGLQSGTSHLTGPGNGRPRKKKCRNRRARHRHKRSHDRGRRAGAPQGTSASTVKAKRCKRNTGRRGAAK